MGCQVTSSAAELTSTRKQAEEGMEDLDCFKGGQDCHFWGTVLTVAACKRGN